MALDLTAIYKRSTQVAFRNLEDKFYIVPSAKDYEGEKVIYYTLNEVAKEIWNRLDGQKAVNQIVNELLDMFDVDAELLFADMHELLVELEQKELVTKVVALNE